MTVRRGAIALLVLALIGGAWWGVDRLTDGQSCDDGQGLRFSLTCIDLETTVIVTTADGVSDLSLLGDFARLRSLEVSLDNVHGDLAGLEKLTSLETLIIHGGVDDPVDLSAIAALDGLEYLQLSRFDGHNLAGVELPNLRELRVSDMTLDGLPVMPALVAAELRAPDLQTWDLSTSPELRQLQIWDGDDLDWELIGTFGSLERLLVLSSFDGQLGLEDFGFVDGLGGLEELHLNGGGTATDLTPLAALPLQALSLDGFAADDLTPLAALTELEELSLEGAPITSLEPLSSTPNLRSLSIGDARLTALDGIESLTALEHLRVTRSPLQDLSALSGLTALTEVSLDETEVVDLTPMAELSEVSLLSLWGTPVTDLSGIENLPLVVIDLNSSSVASLEPLATMTTLETLKIGFTDVVDLAPLRDLPNLTELVPPQGAAAGTRAAVLDLLKP